MKDIKTGTLSVSTDKEYSNGRTIIHGQKAEESIILTLHNIDKIAPVFNTLSAIDGIEISTPSLSSSKTSDYLDKARKAAVKDAMHKAKIYAEAAGTLKNPGSCFYESGQCSILAYHLKDLP